MNSCRVQRDGVRRSLRAWYERIVSFPRCPTSSRRTDIGWRAVAAIGAPWQKARPHSPEPCQGARSPLHGPCTARSPFGSDKFSVPKSSQVKSSPHQALKCSQNTMSRAHLAPCSGLRGRYELTSPQEVAHGLPAASGHHALATWLRLSRHESEAVACAGCAIRAAPGTLRCTGRWDGAPICSGLQGSHWSPTVRRRAPHAHSCDASPSGARAHAGGPCQA